MLTRLWLLVNRFATWKSVLLFLVLFIVMTALMLGKPLGTAQVNEYSNGAGILDGTWNYTPEKTYDILDRQGELGRRAYSTLATLDFVYIIIYTPFLALSLAFLLQRLLAPASALQKSSLLPFVSGLADLGEGVCIHVMLANYPNRLMSIARLANYFTMIKTIAFALCMVGVLLLALTWGIKSLTARK